MRNSVLAWLVAAGMDRRRGAPRLGAVARATTAPRRTCAKASNTNSSCAAIRRFASRRMREECGPITDPQLRQNCMASFDCGPGGPTGQNFRGAPTSERIR